MKCFKFLACAALSIAALSGGCQSGGGQPTSQSESGYRAVVASGGKGTPIVFLLPVGASPNAKPTAMAPDSQAICEGCRAEAANYFSTGKMAAKCPACDAALSPARQQR